MFSNPSGACSLALNGFKYLLQIQPSPSQKIEKVEPSWSARKCFWHYLIEAVRTLLSGSFSKLNDVEAQHVSYKTLAWRCHRPCPWVCGHICVVWPPAHMCEKLWTRVLFIKIYLKPNVKVRPLVQDKIMKSLMQTKTAIRHRLCKIR